MAFSFKVVRVAGSLRSTGMQLRGLRSAAALRATQSKYENYSVTSQTYDQLRAPIGLTGFKDALGKTASRMGKPTTELTVADCGCGTGNYITEIAGDVALAVGVEPNDGMRDQARAKLDELGIANVQLKDASFDCLPMDDRSMDAVMVTQVIHHLYDGDNDFAPVRAALAEVYRVLRPGGTLLLQTQTPTQHVDGFWWSPIIPDAATTLAARFPTVEWLQTTCTGLGFAEDGFEIHVPSEPLVNLVAYANLGGPLLQEFRNADSTWALATEDELAEGLSAWRAKLGSNAKDAAEWFAEREELRAKIGQTTTFIGTVPL